MSELSIVTKHVRKGFHLKKSDFLIFTVGLCAGFLVHNEVMKVLSFCVMGYLFQKSLQEFSEFVLMVFLGALTNGVLALYQLFLIFLFFALLVLFVRVIHVSLFHAMNVVVAVTGFLIVLVHTSNITTALQACLMTYVLMKVCSSEKILIQRKFIVSEMMFCVMMNLILCQMESLLSYEWMRFVLVLYSCCISVYFDSKTCMLNAILMLLVFEMDSRLTLWMMSTWAIHFLCPMRNGLMFLYPVLSFVLCKELIVLGLSLLQISLILMLPERKEWGFVENAYESDLLKQRLKTKEHLLEHQLNQFAGIFDVIVDYYEDSFSKETEFLKGMSESMRLLSLQMKQCTYSQEEEAFHIMELLKGIHYDVEKVDVTFSDTGVRRIVLCICGCIRKDVDDVILPLLWMKIDQNLKVISFKKVQKFSPVVQIELAGANPLSMKAKAYRVLDEKKTSGDTCAVYQNGNHTICTISDGMGAGEKASRASGFVTYLTQRLLSCGIPIEMAVKSMNSLCALSQSEQFATLDFMCLDALTHQMVIAKNGAAPSYLIRGKQVMKIEGHALPLGIVRQISADCYAMEVRKKDLILMCSDGVDETMIESILKLTKTEELIQKIETLLKESEKKDDISLIVAEVL